MFAAPDAHIINANDWEGILATSGSFRAYQNAEAVGAGKMLHSRSEVNAISKHSVIEPNIRAHVTDHAQASADADANFHYWDVCSAFLCLKREGVIQGI